MRARKKKPARKPPYLKRGAAALAALLLIGLASYVAVFFRTDRSLSDMTERWVQTPSRFIDVQGVQVHVRDIGKPDDRVPIVLLPGSESGLFAYEPWMAPLSKDRRVVAVDLPGFGLSAGMPEDDYRSEAYARFVVALLDQLGVQRCVLVGYGFAGEVAWQTAYAHPERVARMVLVTPQGYPSDPWRRSLDDQLLRWSPTAWLGRFTRSRAVVEIGLQDRFNQPELISGELLDRYTELPLHEGNRRAQMLRRAQDRDGNQVERFRTLQAPTLILWGENDRQAPAQQALWFERDIAGSKALMLSHVGHLPLEEAPDRTLAAVQSFLAR